MSELGEVTGPSTARPRGRPNEMEPALLDLALRFREIGVTVSEAADLIPHVANGRRTLRALSSAALRLFNKGILVRQEEWFRPERSPVGAALRFRYWHVDHAPAGADVESAR